MNLLRLLALAVLLGGCRAAPADTRSSDVVEPERSDHDESARAIELTLEQLYAAFDFGPDGEADWDGMRALFAPGAVFYAPIGPSGSAQGVDAERFLADFQAWSRESPDVRDGLHERIDATRVEHLGAIAHAWVTFTGFVPGSGEERTQGVDSIQLVRVGETWKLASFTSHFASEEAPLPARFAGENRPGF